MRIDASRLVSLKPETVELLKNLEIGDTLKGRVLEAAGSSIAIRTAGGQILAAVLQEGISIPKGAYVELSVSGMADGKIYAELKGKSRNPDIDAKLSILLKQIGLPADEKNMEAAKLLVKYKLPLDKEAIINITGLKKSIDSLNQSTEGRLGLLLSGLDIKNTPVDVLNKLVLKWSDPQLSNEIPEKNGLQQVKGAAVDSEAESKLQDGEVPVNNSTSKGIPEGASKSLVSSSAKEFESVSKAAGTPIAMEGEAVSPNDKAVTNAHKEDSVAGKGNNGADILKALEKLGVKAGIEVERFAGQVTDILGSIRKTDMEAITYLVSKELEVTPKNLGLLIRNIENSDGISHFLDKLQQRINAEASPELAEIKESIRKVFLEPRQVEDPDEVSEQLKDIARLGERLESYLESTGSKDPEIRDALTNLRDNIDFIKNINQYNNYMQIPLMINGDTSTAKLYVFKEGKRSKAIDPQNATVLVALDLKSLGHLESMIGVRNKMVNVTFRVENKSIGTVIEKQVDLLKKALGDKGYSIGSVRIINLEQPFSLLSLEAALNEGSSEKIHFDKRI